METVTTTTKKKPVRESAFRVAAAIGALAVLAGIVFVAVQGFRQLPNVGSAVAGAFASLQSRMEGDEELVLTTLESDILINEPFTLNWEHAGKEEAGSYTFFYECRDAVHLQLKNTSGNSDTIFCNTPLNILDTDTSLVLTPMTDLEVPPASIDVPVSVRFIKNNDDRVSAQSTLILEVLREKATSTASTTDSTDGGDGSIDTTTPTTPVTPTNPGRPVITDFQPIGTTTIPSTRISDPNGTADLTVNMLAIGITNKTTAEFTALDKIPHDLPSGMRGALRFEVVNTGTKETGAWRFEAELPTSPSYTYKAPAQVSLFPGERIEFILGFDRVRNRDEDNYEIVVDSREEVVEVSESNNRIAGMVQIER